MNRIYFSMDDKALYLEHGVHADLSQLKTKFSDKSIAKTCQLVTSRAIALCSVLTLKCKPDIPPRVLDAVGHFGLAGMQWAQHLPSDYNITINTAPGVMDHLDRVFVKRDENCQVNVTCQDPHVLLHSGRYSFVYIEADGSAIPYLDAALRSVAHNGMLCVTFTDMPALMNRCPERVARLYGAKMLKSEYIKEMSTRVIISNLVRAAACWNKGISIKLCVFTDIGVTVVCKVRKSPKSGESCSSLVRFLAHCQKCQYRQFLADGKCLKKFTVPIVCCCGKEKDASVSSMMLLGPMWSGNLFCPDFVKIVLTLTSHLKTSGNINKVLQTILIESKCYDNSNEENILLKEIEAICKNNTVNNNVQHKHDDYEPSSKKVKLTYESFPDVINSVELPDAAPFFMDFQVHSVSGSNPPKLLKLIDILRSKGFKASKTHFGPRCLRTNASLHEFKLMLKDIHGKH